MKNPFSDFSPEEWNNLKKVLRRAARDYELMRQAIASSLLPYIDLTSQFEKELKKEFDKVAKQTDLYRRVFQKQIGPLLKQVSDISVLLQDRYEVWKQSLPDNWQKLTAEELQSLIEIMKETGWVLAWVPRQEIVSQLIELPNNSRRGKYMLSVSEEIIADIQDCLNAIEGEIYFPRNTAILQSIIAYESGAHWPAQSFAAVVISVILQEDLEYLKLSEARNDMSGKDALGSLLNMVGQIAVESTIAINLAQYFPGDPMPEYFNRHATIHSLSNLQYTRLNALVAIMNATSLLRQVVWKDEWGSLYKEVG